jgi:hypothetical protein
MNTGELALEMASQGLSLKRIALMLGVKHQWLISVIFNEVKVDFDFGVELEVNKIDVVKFRQEMKLKGLRVFESSYHENVCDIDDPRNWKVENDCSCGKELVSPILKGSDGFHLLRDAVECLNKSNIKIDRSCGFHLHVSRNFFDNDLHIMRFITNYKRLEKSIDGIMPKSRRGNRNKYCRTLKNKQLNVYNADSRYYKVNVNNRNTIELRQHSGTSDWVKISSWIKIIQSLILYSKFKLLETNSELENVLKTHSLKKYIRNRREALNEASRTTGNS